MVPETPKQSQRDFTWEIGVDTGGTFTDCVARNSAGQTSRAKVLSTSALRGSIVSATNTSLTLALAATPSAAIADSFFRGFAVQLPHTTSGAVRIGFIAQSRLRSDGCLAITLAAPASALALTELATGAIVDLIAPFESPILAARLAIDRPHPLPLDDCRISIGTTRGTNALLEGDVSDVTLFVNDGLQDILRIGDQRRSDIFARSPTRAAPLEMQSCGVRARRNADGSEHEQLDESHLRSEARALHAGGARTAAIALLHAGRNPAHESRVETILREEGFSWVSPSHQCGSTSRFEPRARAAVVDAALSGPVGDFIAAIKRDASGAELMMMTSVGGLVPAASFQPRDSLLSGPAGGVAGAAAIARACGFDSCVTLDMGGTSADVARVEREPEIRDETTVGSTTIASPSIAVESVAAGGGSILWWDGDAMRVGPNSAGASPGPACYGQGGPLTLTDANILLGRIDADRLPIPIRPACAHERALELHGSICASGGSTRSMPEMLEAFIAIADEAMANAIRAVTIRRGVDPSGHALICYGGAGGLHACAVAERLALRTVIFPPDAGLLCASGISRAPITRHCSRLILEPLEQCAARFAAHASQLESQARDEISALGVDGSCATIARRVVMMRTVGQEESLEVAWADGDRCADAATVLRQRFIQNYRAIYGFDPQPDRAIEVERMRVQIELCREGATASTTPIESTAPIHPPCAIMRSDSSFHCPLGWQITAHASGALVFTRDYSTVAQRTIAPPTYELVAAQLGAIGSDMGEQLRRTALSPNIKDRLDFSCGILDAQGFLVVNAPHIPIHLGALGPCVRAVQSHCRFAPGDVIAVNHPRFGGSHLPDFTVITPVHSEQGVLIGFAANRAHHAEVGGMRPGSMPPHATTLSQEGVVVEPLHIVVGGCAHFEQLEGQLRSGQWPSRMVDDNLADLRAQVAANELAVQRLRTLFAQSGVECMRDSYAALRASARRASERAIAALPAEIAQIEERLDDGTRLVVAMTRRLDPPRLSIDFTSTSPQHHGNLNAPIAVTRAAIMYSMRVLVGLTLGSNGPAFPMNEGLLDPVEIILPPRTILSPDFSGSPNDCPACAIGQTETSQRLVDLLWRAFNLAACSQGTINNLLFGNAQFGFYETIAGGAGGSIDRAGESGVHTHISNTRITDAEVLERRYPVRLERFAIRHGSGGAGAMRGGDGLIRRIRFLKPVELSFLSQHRIEVPYGLAGGSPGKCATQCVIRADGTIESVAGIVALSLQADDAFEIETPGGGGYGRPLITAQTADV